MKPNETGCGQSQLAHQKEIRLEGRAIEFLNRLPVGRGLDAGGAGARRTASTASVARAKCVVRDQTTAVGQRVIRWHAREVDARNAANGTPRNNLVPQLRV